MKIIGNSTHSKAVVFIKAFVNASHANECFLKQNVIHLLKISKNHMILRMELQHHMKKVYGIPLTN